MANTVENDWDETSPALNQPRRDGATEITALRKAVGHRLAKEHDDPAAAGVGGEHKEGSAKAYYEAAAPTLRPDGVTAFTAADAGRLWVDSDTDELKLRNASAWVAPCIDLKAFDKTVAGISLPSTQSGLLSGTWLVFIQGTHAAAPTPAASFTASVTINGVTLQNFITVNSGGNPPLSLVGLVTVSAGTISITASSNVARIQNMVGIRVGP